ncbi:MAG TPA: hypothetical protein VNL71_01390 [Chloroflexota bacterium]|nr:hypothetical protein [Chloroflexota bacterium]
MTEAEVAQTTPDQEIAAALTALSASLSAAGEPIGAAILAALAAHARRHLAEEAVLVAQGEAEAARTLAKTLAAVAADLDGQALTLDGGPSDPPCGAAEWIAGFAEMAPRAAGPYLGDSKK